MDVIDSFTRSGPYGFFSSFWRTDIRYMDIVFPSLEHAYVAAKLPPDPQWDEMRRRISTFGSAGEAKRIGRTVPLRDGWDTHVKYFVMEDLIEIKFSPFSVLAEWMVATGDAVLIEGNGWHDQLWGDCRCGRPACTAPGANLLGWLLMRHRFRLLALKPCPF